jgi:putative transposase
MTAVSEHPLTDGDTVATGLLREAAIRRLLLHERGECSTEHVRLVASCVGAHERTVWRWLHNAHNPGRTAVERFTITDELRVRLAYFRGNASALRRDLLTQADDPALVPSLTTLYRAIHRDLTEGQRAGLRHGERARRGHDVFLTRPPTHRNAVWEGDHVQASVEVDVHGRLVKPWITWFIDTGTCAICGLAVTAGYPRSDSIMVALRAAITTAEPYGPVGGLPARCASTAAKTSSHTWCARRCAPSPCRYRICRATPRT